MKCLVQERAAQRTRSIPGETQEEPGRESPHRAQNLQALRSPAPSKVVQQHRIKWPTANQRREWCQFDEDATRIIELSFAVERFGVEEGKTTRHNYTMNRRADKIHQLQQELRTLARRFKQLLGQKRSGRLACSKEEVDHFLNNTLSNPDREQELGPLRALLEIPSPTVEFNTRESTLKEVQEVVTAARASSAPGPSGVPYKVYKRCPELLRILWKILRVIWCRGTVADQWRQAEGVWIPKEENSTMLEQFRSISLLSVEGKIFFSVLSRRMTEYLLKNAYIDTSVQKETISKAVTNTKHVCGQRNIAFVRAGEQPQAQSRSAAGMLTSALDWELRVDLGKQLKFPDHIIITLLRPDLVLSSAASKQPRVKKCHGAHGKPLATLTDEMSRPARALTRRASRLMREQFLAPGCV
ncbi:hypothetical protein SKAU_G00414720 [Synaphobranchus kaupii]|uniref:Uncharacterized protein n=1 Tax=Synaphobranchus kaupii TaxID=118154 RepID=A0A9Q1IBE7_SYNKA|nr:hypothetical protein SKAU_G00414720 [Synaphobranchus kaupii]